MARVSYVPYDSTFAQLFEICGITLTVSDFGGQDGWAADAFAAALQRASDYLNEHYDENPDTFETYFEMMDNYSVFYWSTESPIYG